MAKSTHHNERHHVHNKKQQCSKCGKNKRVTTEKVKNVPKVTPMAAGGQQPNLGPAPVVAIVGGGLSGLTAGYRLTQAGYKVVVFEANPTRVGGRCWSKRFPTADGLYDNGQVFELGGELIDNSHLGMKQLCQELGLKLDNTINSELPGTERKMFVAKKTFNEATGEVDTQMVEVSESQAVKDFKTLWTNGLKKDYNAVSYPWLAYPPPGVYTERSNELDRVDLGTYLEQLAIVRENVEDLDYFLQLLKVIYNIEWSGEPWEMSTLDLHSLLPTRGPGKFRFWGESNERFHVRGGNNQLAYIMEEKINTSMGFQTPHEGPEYLGVKRGHKVLKFKLVSNNNYQLTIEANGSTFTQTYARVISALPPSVYRNDERVGPGKDFSWYTDLSEAGISKTKMQAIQNIGFGPIGKINISTNTRFWNTIGWNGEAVATTRYARYLKNGIFTDDRDAKLIEETQFQQCWEVTRGQPGTTGILTDYYIGDYAKFKKDGLHATGRVISGKLDTTAPAEERSTWTSLSIQKDNIDRFLRQLGECNPKLENLARNNLNVDASGDIVNSYESKNWWRDEFTRGAFVFYKPNQETYANGGFSGVEPFAEPIFTDETETTETDILDRTLHFAGSSTNYDWNGWMEGAVVSGDDSATQVMSVFMDQGYTTNI